MADQLKVCKYEGRDVILGEDITTENEEKSSDGCLSDSDELNFVLITNMMLKSMPPGIGEFSKVLVLTVNECSIKKLPQIKYFCSLQHLNVAKNCLTKLSSKISLLKNILSINISFNEIKKLPNLKNSKLNTLDLSNNHFENFPTVQNLNFLSTLKLDSNKIETIPALVRLLTSLDELTITNNELRSVPLELGSLSLTVLKLGGNPLTDKNLKKTLRMEDTEQILFYIRNYCISNAVNEWNLATDSDEESDSSDYESDDEPEIQPPPCPFVKYIRSELSPATEVFRLENEVGIRKFILCVVIKNVHFTYLGYRNFFRLQNVLHAICCDDRNLASIGMHDFDLFPNQVLTYTCVEPTEIIFRPVGTDMYITAEVYFTYQRLKAARLRKRHKIPSGFSRCLTTLEKNKAIPCLMTKDFEEVISIPPLITTCEDFKVRESTQNIFVEVTTQHSYILCKRVMEILLIELCQLGICDAALNNGDVNGDKHYLHLAAVDINNSDGSCFLHYPSMQDLSNFENNVQVTFIC